MGRCCQFSLTPVRCHPFRAGGGGGGAPTPSWVLQCFTTAFTCSLSITSKKGPARCNDALKIKYLNEKPNTFLHYSKCT